MKRCIVVICSAIALCAFSCINEARETGTFTIDAGTFDILDIETVNGTIDINNGSGENAVPVGFIKKAQGLNEAAAQKNLSRIKIDSILVGRTYKIVVTVPPMVNGGVDFTITNLNGKRVILKSSNGAIDCEEILGGDIKAANGDVNITNVLTDIAITSQNGMVTVNGVGERITVNSTSGDVNVRIAGTDTVNGALSTVNGSVNLDLSDTLSCRVLMGTQNGFVIVGSESLGQSAERILGSGLGLLNVQTVNGNISLELF